MAHLCPLKPCKILRKSVSCKHAYRAFFPLRNLRRVCWAGEPDNGPPSSSDEAYEIKEASLERLEASIRGKAAPARVSTISGSPGKGPKPIPIRGVSQQQRKIDSQYENMADWKEGQLFPEGWESMSVSQKLTELYLGRRGVLFWANKAAYASVFVLLGGWIIFRFVGPALGLYKLAGDFAHPPL